VYSQPRVVKHRPSSVPLKAEQAILDAVRNLDYGSVEITVHASRVVQIECRKKIRLEPEEPTQS
jgi:hypothetical protein